MIVLGLGFTDHEASAALVMNGRLATAISRERLTRLKKDGKTWGTHRLDLSPAIQYCLEANGLTLSDVDLLVLNHIDHIHPAELFTLLTIEGSMDLSLLPLLVLPHHFAHACSAFYPSPFSEAAVFIADGSGGPLDGLNSHCGGPEPALIKGGDTIVQNLRRDRAETAREQESFYYCDGQRWQLLRKIAGDWNGIGAEYGSVSEFLFGDCLDAGKTMGLSPYGKPLSDAIFLERLGSEEMVVFRSMHSPERDKMKGKVRSLRDSQHSLDYLAPLPSAFAASVQFEVEEALLVYAHWLRHRTKSANLCFAGGVALNCVANSRLASETEFDKIFIPPAPGDDGIAIGCALYGAAQNGELQRGACPVFLGRSHSHDARNFKELGLVPVSTLQSISEETSERLAAGSVVAWYQAGSEIGPRALGHRSFLADPRTVAMRDHLNRVVKNREMFRPFAPVVLEESVAEYFEDYYPSYFMSFVARVRPEKRSAIPAVTHVDGSARYQVLRRHDNPELFELVVAFARRTGIPMLLNTSFNRAGEPIVETPMEAARCMLASSVSFLVVDGRAYCRESAGR